MAVAKQEVVIALAGLPQETLREVLKVASPPEGYRLMGAAAGGRDEELFSRSACEALLRGIAEFTIRRHIQAVRRRLRHGDRPHPDGPTPKEIHLLYVRGRDSEKLLRAFDFFALPLPLGPASDLQWRFDAECACRIVESAAKRISEGTPKELRLLRAHVPSAMHSPLKLPARNFLVQRDQDIALSFQHMTSGRVRWEQVIDEVAWRKLKKKKGRGSRRCMYDARERFFPPDPEPHGLIRPDDDPEQKRSIDELCFLMNGLYRFGQPLTDGYHFDVQRETGQQLMREEFSCSRKGRIEVTGTHANVYPNDFVRR